MSEQLFHKKVTWASFLCCLLVILNHSGNAALFFPGGGAPAWLLLLEEQVFYAFVRVDIPCFLMLSGYLFFRGLGDADRPFDVIFGKWRRRASSLLVPYLLWNTLYYLAYAAGSRIPPVSAITGKDPVPVSVPELLRAVFLFGYHPVFWFMFQLILLVLLAPALFLVLRRRASALLFGAFLCVVWYLWPSVPVLNPDALIYYSIGAAFAMHGREAAERRFSARRALLSLGMLAVCAFLYLLFLKMQTPQPLVLYLCLMPPALWMLLDEGRLPDPARWMRDTFFIYAFHFIPVRLLGRIFAAAFPGNATAAFLLYLAMPFLAAGISIAAAETLGRLLPGGYRVLSGGR